MLDQRVLGLDQDLDHGLFIELIERCNDRETPDQLGDQAELDEVLRFDFTKHRTDCTLRSTANLGPKSDTASLRAIADDFLEAVEGTTTNEQDVGGIDLNKVLVGMLASALRGNRCHSAFDELEQGLLHALTRDITRNARVVGLAGDLVDLVDIDDAVLGFLDFVIAVLQQLLNDVLDIFTDITCFGQRGGIGDHEGHIEHAGERLGEQRFAAAGGANQQDIALGKLDFFFLALMAKTLVVVVDRDRKNLLGNVLTDDVLVENGADLVGRRQAGLEG